jgi:SAM-dependent methyltransferase
MSQSSYNPEFYKPLFAIEDRHFWFQGRNLVISTIVKQVLSILPAGFRLLEVGCGNGNVLRVLEMLCAEGSVIGMDLFNDGLRHAQMRTDCPLVQGDVQLPPFSVPFDLIGLFDVLEHLQDDLEILDGLNKLLTFQGVLLLTVPADPSLWSYFDIGHYRRYKLDELEHKLLITGYRIEYITHYMLSIYPIVWLGRRLAMRTDQIIRRGESDSFNLAKSELRILPVVNELIRLLLALEVPMIAKHSRLPLGTSILAVARKNS